METGWIKIHRKILDKGFFKDSEYFHIWMYLLLNANHKDKEFLWDNKTIIVKRGSFITSRNKIHLETRVNESKIERILNFLKSEQQIEQQTNNRSRLIVIVNYDGYQKSEQQNEQPVNNQRTTSEHKQEGNNVRMKEIHTQVCDYLNAKAKKNFRANNKAMARCIDARVSEGFVLEDFKHVIDAKVASWGQTDMGQYIRPETLFGSKFEGYRNEKHTVVAKEEIPYDLIYNPNKND